MANVTVDLPDNLVEAARRDGIDFAALTQQALRYRLAQRRAAGWLRTASLRRPTRLTHEEDVFALLRTAREDFESG